MKQCTCENCETKFLAKEHRPGRFCCWTCYLASRPKRTNQRCEGCGCTFTPSPNSRKGRRFCSIQCYRTNANGKKHSCYQHEAPIVACKQCGVPVRRTTSFKERSFCNATCWRKYQKRCPRNGYGICPVCGTSFFRLHKTQRCCGIKCQKLFYRYENSACWKGGEYESYEGFIFLNTKTKRTTGRTVGQSIYRRKHRVVVEKAIGRKLFSDEKIWHIDRYKSNNRVENLYIFRSQSEMARAINAKQLPTQSNIQAQEFARKRDAQGKSDEKNHLR